MGAPTPLDEGLPTDVRPGGVDAATPAGADRRRVLALLALGAVLWVAAYAVNEWLWDAVARWLGWDLEERVPGAVHFFLYDSVKIGLLLTGLMFVVGLLRASLDLNRARQYLEGRGLVVGLLLAIALGAVTPFCSCSSIPLFIGFVAAGIPLAITLTFLMASPLISEVAAVMIGEEFGWHVAANYVAAGAAISFVVGWTFSRFDLSRWVEDLAVTTKLGALRADGHEPTLAERVDAARSEAVDIFRSVWKWVLLGVGVGAAIHGWVPEDFFVRFAGPDDPLAVVVATLAGAPLYVNGAGVVPIAEALWAKGVSLGTVMAFVMSTIALSVPQAVMLRRVLKPPLLAIYFGTLLVGIILIGTLFNVFA